MINSLAEIYPEIAKEWHPTKNGDLKPENVSYGSNKKVWWYLPYDDPKSGKHFDFEWTAHICDRHKYGCPYLAGNAVWQGYNDLASLYPEIAREWHPSKNGTLAPFDVTAKSGKKVWWHLPYDDPETGKHFEFEWMMSVGNRTLQKQGCPYISGKAVWKGYNDLATKSPKIAAMWHPTKNGGLEASDIIWKSGKKYWWFYPYDDPKTGKHFDFEWRSSPHDMNKSGGCPFLSGHRVWYGFNDLESNYPEIAKDWDYSLNGSLKPSQITANSNKKVHWVRSYDDPDTGKHFDFRWITSPNARVSGSDCPYLSSPAQACMKGFNDLESKNPDLASQWHPIKNGNLKPDEVLYTSPRKIWWLQTYDDPFTGQTFHFEWKAAITVRQNGSGCPYLGKNGKLWKGFNDLQTKNPELAKEWHSTKNGKLTPSDVTEFASRKVWWIIRHKNYCTGEENVYEWKALISNRSSGHGCPFICQSLGEQFIQKYLEDNGISFSVQKTFPGMRGSNGGALRYDFFVSGAKDVAIEYQGAQHFHPVEYFGGEKGYQMLHDNDILKKNYSATHDIHLLEVPYTENTYEKVKIYLDRELAAFIPCLR